MTITNQYTLKGFEHLKIMLRENLLLKCFSFCLITIHFLQTAYAYGELNNFPNCSPSACGNIHNISHPFRLKDDPLHCGDPSCELACENNTASIYVYSHKYLVQAINYHNYTIRLAYPAIKKDDTCSFPHHHLSEFNGYVLNRCPYPYSVYSERNPSTELIRTISFISCPYPLNYSFLLEASHCFNESIGRHTYIKFGHLLAADVPNKCRVTLMVTTSVPDDGDEERVLSLSEIHGSLLYGFELSWFDALCGPFCTDTCWLDGNTPICGGIPDNHKNIHCNFHFYRRRWEIWCDKKGNQVWLYNAIEWINRSRILYVGIGFAGVNLAGRIIIGMPMMLGLLIYKLRRRNLSMFDVIEGFLQSNNNLMPIRYSYWNIKQMSRNFREKLGEGGYGSVYKGKLRSGRDVAVKVLSNKPKTLGQDFINEVATIGRIHHVNVVKLVGYCVERSKCALIYDFMPNGSLEKYIFNDERASSSLSWERKYDIAIGVARGIEYLHSGCDIQILHFDIKPHNILLDNNFTPKISDFGLAKFYSSENAIVTLTAARGTIGYVAPELINRSIGRVSYKADVYSFGMLLMELLHLNRDMGTDDNKSSQYFPHWIYDRFNKGKDIEIGTTYENHDDEDDECARKITRKMTIVGLWCIQMSPDDRPSMSEVVKMFEGENENLQIPPQPSQSPQVASISDESWGTESTDSVALLSTSNACNGE